MDEDRPSFLNYDVRDIHNPLNKRAASWTTLISNLQGTSRQKTGLASATTYEWQIRSACSSDTSTSSAWSSTQTFTTLTPCTVPLNPVATAITPTAATLTWDAIAGSWGYRVRYRTSPNGPWTFDTTNTNSITISGLSTSTAYQWRVKGLCDEAGTNTSPWTATQTFTTVSCNMSLSATSSNVTCNGGSDGSIDLSVSGGSGSYTYSWSNGATTQDLTSLSAGSYSTIVSDANGCETSVEFTVSEPDVLLASVSVHPMITQEPSSSVASELKFIAKGLVHPRIKSGH